jgi:hypothetical protein
MTDDERGFDALVAYERAKVDKGEAYWNGPHPFTEDRSDHSMCLCGVPESKHDEKSRPYPEGMDDPIPDGEEPDWDVPGGESRG